MPDDNISSRPRDIDTRITGDGVRANRGVAVAAPVTSATWNQVIANLGVQIAIAVVVALLAFLIQWFMGTKPATARTLSLIIGFGALWAARTFVHYPIPRSARTTQVQLPPNVRPSETAGREVVETVVFVVVLVLLLKSFAAEAFVIPTGSMAESEYGYHKDVVCPACSIEFPVNCSSEADPQDGPRVTVSDCKCPNCRKEIKLVSNDPNQQLLAGVAAQVKDPGVSTGDRVLVSKFLYDLPLPFIRGPQRFDVVVFKFPEGPQKNLSAMNYIKRLVGLPGESIGLWCGDLYVLDANDAPTYDDSHLDPLDLWKVGNVHANDEPLRRAWETKKFRIVRKPPEVLLSMMRPVYDNDHQAQDLQGKRWQRWKPDAQPEAWEEQDEGRSFRHGSRVNGGKESWLRYEHLLRDDKGKPSFIDDFLGYNSIPSANSDNGHYWVGDLILECEVTVDKDEGEFALELVRSGDRFQAAFSLDNDTCTLRRFKHGETKAVDLETAQAKLKKGTHQLRFANVDQRLTVWLNEKLLFEDGVNIDAPSENYWRPMEEDLKPAGIGVRGGTLAVRKIKLYRDTYYTHNPNKLSGVSGEHRITPDGDGRGVLWFSADRWERLSEPSALTIYVQPKHYLCLGDNSTHSSDGRTWGLVPQRLMLGRALMVYWPAGRVGRIR